MQAGSLDPSPIIGGPTFCNGISGLNLSSSTYRTFLNLGFTASGAGTIMSDSGPRFFRMYLGTGQIVEVYVHGSCGRRRSARLFSAGKRLHHVKPSQNLSIVRTLLLYIKLRC
jgi:hypothetical protein